MKLRAYQHEASLAAMAALEEKSHPVLQLATGTGKSLIIADLAERYRAVGKSTLVLTHVQQLVKQNAETYTQLCRLRPAVVCSGLCRKDATGPVTFATIQSMQSRLAEWPAPDLIIIDEAHRVPHNEGEPTLYESMLRRYPDAGRLAMTATPWRMDNGRIYGDGDHFWFDKLAYDYPVLRAVKEGWLCPLVGVEAKFQLDVKDVSVKGDFVQSEVDALQVGAWLKSMAKSLIKLVKNRQHIAVYCPSVSAAERTAKAIQSVTGWQTDVLASSTKGHLRDSVLNRFQNGKTRVLCSVDMLTTGFDFPALDCIVCLRPTLSSSLWVQIQGRGTRLSPGKKNCLILDYAGNLQRLGGVGMYETFYRQRRENEETEEVEAVPTKPYIKRERNFLPGVRTIVPIDPMTGLEAGEGATIDVSVSSVSAVAITTRRNPFQPILMVKYACLTQEGGRIDASAFVTTQSAPNQRSEEFFKKRGMAVNLPIPARIAAARMKEGRHPISVTVRKSGAYWNVTKEHFGEDA